VQGLGEGLIEKLKTAGVTTVEALADMTPEQLEAIEGIGPKTVERISLAVSDYFSSLEAASSPAGEAESTPAEAEAAPADAQPGDEPEVATEETREAGGESETAEALESADQAEPHASSDAEDKPESFTAVEKKP
jgi:N utilization substance protein A